MQLPEQIEAKRILLKHPTNPTFQLAEELYAVVNQSRESLDEWLGWVHKTNSAEDHFTNFFINWSQKHWKEGSGFAYIIHKKEDNKALGVVDLFHIDDESQSGEFGYWLGNEAAGHGYMQEAIKALEAAAFQAGINRIVIENDPQNFRSVHVAQKCGYILEGVLRQNVWDGYHKRLADTNVWAKLKSDWEKEGL